MTLFPALVSSIHPVTAPTGITLVAHTAKQATTTDAINTTGANLLVLVFIENGPCTATPTDSYSNTWTQGTIAAAAGLTNGVLWWAQNAIVGTGHTFTCSGSFSSLGVIAVSGAKTTSAFDKQAVASTSGTSLQPGSITPTTDGQLIVEGVGFYADTFNTIDSGMTILDQVFADPGHCGLGLTYKVQSTAAAINPTSAFTGSAWRKVNMIASFKAP